MSPTVRIEHVTLGNERQSDYAPAYGVRGALTYKGRNKVQCHICGKYFSALGIHVVQTHEISAQDYRFEFGLPHTIGLVSESLHERFQQGNGQRLKALHMIAYEKARHAHQQLWADPEWARRQAERSSIRQGGRRIAVQACVICASEFRVKASQQGKTVTCSKACSSQWRSRQMTGRIWTPEAKTAQSLRKRGPRVIERCTVCGMEYETAAHGSRRSATCKTKSCVIEAVRRWHTGRRLSDAVKAVISQKARSNFTPERMQQLKDARALESSVIWQFRRMVGHRSVWRREDVATLFDISLNHATAILSKCCKDGELRRVSRGAYAAVMIEEEPI